MSCEEYARNLRESALKLALSLIKRKSWDGYAVCSECDHRADLPLEIEHNAACKVGKVVSAELAWKEEEKHG